MAGLSSKANRLSIVYKKSKKQKKHFSWTKYYTLTQIVDVFGILAILVPKNKLKIDSRDAEGDIEVILFRREELTQLLSKPFLTTNVVERIFVE